MGDATSPQTGIDEALHVGADLLSKLLGSSFEAVGHRLGDFLADEKKRNLNALRYKLEETRLKRQIAVEQVELKLLNHLFTYACLEENADLQQVWANMLLNAGDTRHLISVAALFPYMLSNLGVRDVKFLDSLFEDAVRVAASMPTGLNLISQVKYDNDGLFRRYCELGFSAPGNNEMTEDFWVMIDLLRYQGIIQVVFFNEPYRAAYAASVYETHDTVDPLVRRFHITDLGVAFIRACRPPA